MELGCYWSFFCPPDDTRTNVEQELNDAHTGNPKVSEKSLSECHFFHHKSHVDCNKILLEKLIFAQLLNNLHVFYRTRSFFAVFTSPPLSPASEHINLIHNLTHYFFKTDFNNIPVFQAVSSLQTCRINSCMHFLFLPCLLHASPI